jgi:hypothetical protein
MGSHQTFIWGYGMKEMYFFMNKDKYIGLDSQSGGYPYETDNPLHAHMFISKDDAEKYKKMFKESWLLCKFIGLNYVPIITIKED